MKERNIPASTMRRLPVYLHYLHSVRGERRNISSTAIAAAFGLNDVQVRKDLAAASGAGRPRTGYDLDELIAQIELCLGYGSHTKTIMMGAGNLGKALLSFNGFRDYGLDIIAAFDPSPALDGTLVNNKPVLALEKLEDFCRAEDVKLGIITTPVHAAQATCDRLIACGMKAIWNFAPTILRAPEGVLVENENLASSLAILSKHLLQLDGEEQG